MKILVTGAAGRVGSVVARDLLEHGHEVRIFERTGVEADLRERCELVYGDLSDRLALLQATQGCEAIAHLGAIPNPTGDRDLALFSPNVLGTQYLFAAAEANGISRLALASSCSVYGMPFQKNGTLEPQYLPMTEEHPILNEDVYALSKQCNEITAAMYARRTGMATTCLRLSMVTSFQKPHHWQRRMFHYNSEHKSTDLWSYVEVRDVAKAFRLSLEKLETGYQVLNIVARDYMGQLTPRELIERHYPNLVPYLNNGFDYEKLGFWDTRRAEEALGWKSEYHWRDVPELAVDGAEEAKK